jgi:hypothetical protein
LLAPESASGLIPPHLRCQLPLLDVVVVRVISQQPSNGAAFVQSRRCHECCLVVSSEVMPLRLLVLQHAGTTRGHLHHR